MADRYAVEMIDWRGHKWDFTGDGWLAGITSGGIDGLVGSVVDTVADPLGQSGHVVVAQRAEAMRGSVTFHCRGDERHPVEHVVGEFRRAFSGSVRRRNLLTVVSPLGRLSTRVRLDGPFPALVEDPSWSEVVRSVRVPLVADDGVWWLPVTRLYGTCSVTNFGDVPVWVRIRWFGKGGVVTMPSEAKFTLPPAPGERVLHLSRQDSLVVRDREGNVDAGLWKQLRSVFPEGVPVGEQRKFVLPAGAQLECEIGVMDPWQ